jgi:hypothetical protein
MAQIVEPGRTVNVTTAVTEPYAVEGGTLIVSSTGSITAPDGGVGGASAARLDLGSLEVQGGSLTGGDGSTGGGQAVWQGGGTAQVTSGSLIGGQGGTGGGVAYYLAGGALHVSGGTFTGGPGGTSGSPGLYVLQQAQETPSVCTVSGGTFNGSGGTIAIYVNGNATVSISGGQFATAGGPSLYAYERAAVMVTGGSFNGSWSAYDRSTITVLGTGLTLANGRLTGTLADGSSIDIAVKTDSTSQIVVYNS